MSSFSLHGIPLCLLINKRNKKKRIKKYCDTLIRNIIFHCEKYTCFRTSDRRRHKVKMGEQIQFSGVEVDEMVTNSNNMEVGEVVTNSNNMEVDEVVAAFNNMEVEPGTHVVATPQQETWNLETLLASPAVADWMAREVVSLSITGFDIFLFFVFIIFALEMVRRNRITNNNSGN